MGLYIQAPQNQKKAEYFISEHRAEAIHPPENYNPPEGRMYICIVENPGFEAALVVNTMYEFQATTGNPDDNRPRRWITMPESEVAKLCPEAFR